MLTTKRVAVERFNFTSQSKKVNIVVGFKPSMVMIIGYIVSSLGWLFVLLMLIRSLRSKIKQ